MVTNSIPQIQRRDAPQMENTEENELRCHRYTFTTWNLWTWSHFTSVYCTAVPQPPVPALPRTVGGQSSLDIFVSISASIISPKRCQKASVADSLLLFPGSLCPPSLEDSNVQRQSCNVYTGKFQKTTLAQVANRKIVPTPGDLQLANGMRHHGSRKHRQEGR